MRLTHARVQNYKSINDSTEFGLDAVTCLVGKNESGKTALLQALHRLNPETPGVEFNDLEYPRMRWSEYKERKATRPDNVLTTRWKLDEADKKLIAASFGPDALANDEITVSKGYTNQLWWTAPVNESAVVKYVVEKADLFAEERTKYQNLVALTKLKEVLAGQAAPSERENALSARLNELFGTNTVAQAVISSLSSRLPKFVYFAEYFRLSGDVAIDALASRKAPTMPSTRPEHRGTPLWRLSAQEEVLVAIHGGIRIASPGLRVGARRNIVPLVAGLSAPTAKARSWPS